MFEADHNLDRHTRGELYRRMVRIRVVEETIANRYAEQKMRCPVHLSVGQEAAAVGVCAALKKMDQLASTHRCHSHYLAKGGSLEAMIAEIHGKATGCCGGRGGSMHLFDETVGMLASVPIVGSNVPLAVGAALAFKQRAEAQVAVAFFGDGALEEGVVHEAANFAATNQLPVIFALENNLYSVYTPLDQRQPERDFSTFAKTHSMPSWDADGNDVLAVRHVALEAVERARLGSGPSLLVLNTYRWREHCGPNYDDELGYRPAGELEHWQERCPIRRFGDYLQDRGELSADEREQAFQGAQQEVDEVFERVERAPFPEARTAAGGVYA